MPWQDLAPLGIKCASAIGSLKKPLGSNKRFGELGFHNPPLGQLLARRSSFGASTFPFSPFTTPAAGFLTGGATEEFLASPPNSADVQQRVSSSIDIGSETAVSPGEPLLPPPSVGNILATPLRTIKPDLAPLIVPLLQQELFGSLSKATGTQGLEGIGTIGPPQTPTSRGFVGKEDDTPGLAQLGGVDLQPSLPIDISSEIGRSAPRDGSSDSYVGHLGLGLAALIPEQGVSSLSSGRSPSTSILPLSVPGDTSETPGSLVNFRGVPQQGLHFPSLLSGASTSPPATPSQQQVSETFIAPSTAPSTGSADVQQQRASSSIVSGSGIETLLERLELPTPALGDRFTDTLSTFASLARPTFPERGIAPPPLPSINSPRENSPQDIGLRASRNDESFQGRPPNSLSPSAEIGSTPPLSPISIESNSSLLSMGGSLTSSREPSDIVHPLQWSGELSASGFGSLGLGLAALNLGQMRDPSQARVLNKKDVLPGGQPPTASILPGDTSETPGSLVNFRGVPQQGLHFPSLLSGASTSPPATPSQQQVSETFIAPSTAPSTGSADVQQQRASSSIVSGSGIETLLERLELPTPALGDRFTDTLSTFASLARPTFPERGIAPPPLPSINSPRENSPQDIGLRASRNDESFQGRPPNSLSPSAEIGSTPPLSPISIESNSSLLSMGGSLTSSREPSDIVHPLQWSGELSASGFGSLGLGLAALNLGQMRDPSQARVLNKKDVLPGGQPPTASILPGDTSETPGSLINVVGGPKQGLRLPSTLEGQSPAAGFLTGGATEEFLASPPNSADVQPQAMDPSPATPSREKQSGDSLTSSENQATPGRKKVTQAQIEQMAHICYTSLVSRWIERRESHDGISALPIHFVEEVQQLKSSKRDNSLHPTDTHVQISMNIQILISRVEDIIRDRLGIDLI